MANRGKKTIVAIDLGGTLLRAGLVEDREIKYMIKQDTPQDKKELKKALQDSINQLLEKNGVSIEDISGIGISSAGPLKDGSIVNPPNLNFERFGLEKFVSEKFDTDVEVENDANCAALAEAKLGVKKDNFFVLTLGTGIGGGIIINNEIYKGQGSGGELGHIYLEDDKDFEDLASGKREKQLAKDKLGEELLFSDLVDDDRDEAEEILNELSHYLGKGIGSLINVFDPEVVVLAGGVREAGKDLLNKIQEETDKYVIIPNNAKVKWSKLDEPGVLGASLLV